VVPADGDGTTWRVHQPEVTNGEPVRCPSALSITVSCRARRRVAATPARSAARPAGEPVPARGEQQLPRPDGTTDHRVPLGTLKAVGCRGAASIEGHGSGGWPLATVTEELRASDAYVRDRLAQL
jgi:hypothetical protein